MKKCPFCNGAASLWQKHGRHGWFVWVECTLCGSTGRTYSSPDEPAATGWENDACELAVQAWNTRVEPEKEIIDKLLERLEERLKNEID